MLRILVPGQQPPSWLERIELSEGSDAKVRIGVLCVVTIGNDEEGRRCYNVRHIFPGCGYYMVAKGDADSLSISGQSPDGDGAAVRWMASPVIEWPWLALAAGICAALLARG